MNRTLKSSRITTSHPKFFYYLPETLIINNIEFDHADIYGSLGEITKAFRQLVNTVPRQGLIIAHAADDAVADVLSSAQAPVQTFGIETDAFWRADIVSSTPQGTDFTLYQQNFELGSFHLPLHGEYNVRNALASIAACHHAGIAANTMQSSLASFKGVKRRQEVLGEWGNILLIDDFAHHPTAISTTLQGIRNKAGGKRVLAVLEPRSNTMRMGVHQAALPLALVPSASETAVSATPSRARIIAESSSSSSTDWGGFGGASTLDSSTLDSSTLDSSTFDSSTFEFEFHLSNSRATTTRNTAATSSHPRRRRASG